MKRIQIRRGIPEIEGSSQPADTLGELGDTIADTLRGGIAEISGRLADFTTDRRPPPNPYADRFGVSHDITSRSGLCRVSVTREPMDRSYIVEVRLNGSVRVALTYEMIERHSLSGSPDSAYLREWVVRDITRHIADEVTEVAARLVQDMLTPR